MVRCRPPLRLGNPAMGWSANAPLLCCLSGFPRESKGITGQGCECGEGPERWSRGPYAERIIVQVISSPSSTGSPSSRVLVRNPNCALMGGSLRTPMPATEVSGLVFVPRVSEYRSVDVDQMDSGEGWTPARRRMNISTAGGISIILIAYPSSKEVCPKMCCCYFACPCVALHSTQKWAGLSCRSTPDALPAALARRPLGTG